MSLIIDETNKAALKKALGVSDLEARVKALESANTQASGSSGSSGDPDPDTLDPNS